LWPEAALEGDFSLIHLQKTWQKSPPTFETLPKPLLSKAHYQISEENGMTF
jgi:hypothetical protein